MPGFGGAIVNSVKLFTGLQTGKMFNLSDGIIPPVFFYLLLFWQRLLFYRSLFSFLF